MKGILIISPFFYPNIGGVETHLSDLVKELSKKYKVFVHTYSPITTQNTSWQKKEKSKNLVIFRHGWFGKNLFHKLEKYSILQFLYLTPYLFLKTSQTSFRCIRPFATRTEPVSCGAPV